MCWQTVCPSPPLSRGLAEDFDPPLLDVLQNVLPNAGRVVETPSLRPRNLAKLSEMVLGTLSVCRAHSGVNSDAFGLAEDTRGDQKPNATPANKWWLPMSKPPASVYLYSPISEVPRLTRQRSPAIP